MQLSYFLIQQRQQNNLLAFYHHLHLFAFLLVCIYTKSTICDGDDVTESVTFRSVKPDSTIVEIAPFYNQRTHSITECYLVCLQRLEQCCYIETANVGEAWSCRLFNFFPSLPSSTATVSSAQSERNSIAPYLRPLIGSHVSSPRLAQDCVEWKQYGYNRDGVYVIRNWKTGDAYRKVYCDMTTDGGGWIVMQRRADGSVDFQVDWNAYRNGFGDVYGTEHWLGNEFVHRYTDSTNSSASATTELMGEAVSFDGERASVRIQHFRIGNEAAKYALDYDTCEALERPEISMGLCGDWVCSKGSRFTTLDRDNDARSSENCAIRFSGGWWHKTCFYVNLNGKYTHVEARENYGTNIHWRKFKGFSLSLRKTKMLIRRRIR